MKLRPPSPALVVAGIALIVASAGTAYGAATIITSTGQIRNGAVQSADVKDGSIQGRDIRNGTITANKLKTAPGGGTAYVAVRRAGPEGQPANQVMRIASLTVPAGAYVVNAKTVMSALLEPQSPLGGLIQQGGALGGRCKLDAAGDGDESLTNIVINQRQTPATLTMQVTRTVGAPAEFTLDCSAGVPFRLSETSIIATPVGNVALTELPQ